MALNLQSLSITSAFNSIVNFFKSQENQSKWRDLSVGSEGAFLIRLLANVISTLSYRIVAQSRENYLSTAALPSSNIGIAVNLGYSVFRGSNLRRRIWITPNGTYTLPKFSVIGTYDAEHTILTLKDTDLIEGQTTEVETVVGNLREETFIAGSEDTKIFTLFTPNISNEDYILLKDGEEVPTSDNIKKLNDDFYVVRTNPYSSVDIIYLNDIEGAKYTYGTGTEFTLQYVELDNVNVIPYSDNMFPYGTLEDVSTISIFKPFASVESIKVRAPLHNETQNLIRSKKDYANRLHEIIQTIAEASYYPITPTYTQISYIKDNCTLLTGSQVFEGTATENSLRLEDTEIKDVKDILKEENYFGTPLPDIVPPRREVADLDISLALTNKYKSISDVTLDIENILENYFNTTLAMTFSTYELERIIENLSYVKYARVSYKINERTPNTNFQLGYLIENDGIYYKASKVLGFTGQGAPENGWPIPENDNFLDIDTNIVIKDGTIYWKCYKMLPNISPLAITTWGSGKPYGIGDFMKLPSCPNYMFKCVDLVRDSGSEMPDTAGHEPGDFIVDGGLVWVVKDKISEAPIWESLHQYQLGQNVNGMGSYSLECISYTGATGASSSISFEPEYYPIVAQDRDNNTFSVAGNQETYFQENDAITASYDEGYTTFEVVSSVYNSALNRTLITVGNFTTTDPNVKVIPEGREYINLYAVQRGTFDGNIAWSIVEDPSKIKYNWNSYVTFTPHITVLEA